MGTAATTSLSHMQTAQLPKSAAETRSASKRIEEALPMEHQATSETQAQAAQHRSRKSLWLQAQQGDQIAHSFAAAEEELDGSTAQGKHHAAVQAATYLVFRSLASARASGPNLSQLRFEGDEGQVSAAARA
ncbi:hypothetical protein WJX74_010428 [Apatococcus lobatus]|uniref:Uncharacterized protein n=1 Tax=Apatococcus lobatus TaxID=904363 RepID=A0AAW1S1C8_9CHLO